MIFFFRILACGILASLFVGCAPKEPKSGLQWKYDLTVKELREYLSAYSNSDYAYEGSKDTLAYLEKADFNSLNESQITSARKHIDCFVVYWVGDSLEVKGINVSSSDLVESIFVEIPDFYFSEVQKAESKQLDFVAKFPIPEIKALENIDDFRVQLVRGNGSLSSFFELK